jgi:hypothetical protein
VAPETAVPAIKRIEISLCSMKIPFCWFAEVAFFSLLGVDYGRWMQTRMPSPACSTANNIGTRRQFGANQEPTRFFSPMNAG